MHLLAPTRKRQEKDNNLTSVFTFAFPTEMGWFALAVTERQLLCLVFNRPSRNKALSAVKRILQNDGLIDQLGAEYGPTELASIEELDEETEFGASLVDRLEQFASGEPQDFRDILIWNEDHTQFTNRVLTACQRIPWGQTRSYGDLASKCGSPGAARAVGQVMANNRCPLVIPCHRVLGAQGRMGGFSAPGGVQTKRRLLDQEQAV